MAVGIDEPGSDDAAFGVDDLCVLRSIDVLPDRLDRVPDDQDIRFLQHGAIGVHGDDRAVGEKDRCPLAGVLDDWMVVSRAHDASLLVWKKMSVRRVDKSPFSLGQHPTVIHHTCNSLVRRDRLPLLTPQSGPVKLITEMSGQ